MSCWGRTFFGSLLIGELVLSAVALAIVLLVPSGVGMALAVWVVASLPVGVALGHCTLNGDE